MEDYLEYDILTYLNSEKNTEEINKYRDLGIELPEGMGEKEERVIKYSFNPKNIIEFRQTYVEHKGKYLDATVVSLTNNVYETPPLMVHYDEFKKHLKEWNEAN